MTMKMSDVNCDKEIPLCPTLHPPSPFTLMRDPFPDHHPGTVLPKLRIFLVFILMYQGMIRVLRPVSSYSCQMRW